MNTFLNTRVINKLQSEIPFIKPKAKDTTNNSYTVNK